MLLYQIVHRESGHKYVGQTSRPSKERWREHLYSLRKGKHQNRYLQAAWTKYGEAAFVFEIVKEFNSLDELNKSEIELIKTGTNLYNLAEGGCGHIHSKEIKKKIGEAAKKPIVGMCITTGEIKEYASASDAKADGFNEKCVRKCVLGSISKRKDGTTFESISHKGWVWTNKESLSIEELKKKCESAKRAKVRNERPVIGINVLTKEVVNFRSSNEAGRAGFNGMLVNRACRKFSAIHKGFVWSYADIDSPQSLLERKISYVLSETRTGPKSWL